MNTLRLGLRENQTAFVPGETIAGAADWACERPPKSAELRLCWVTQGKGTEDACGADGGVPGPQSGRSASVCLRRAARAVLLFRQAHLAALGRRVGAATRQPLRAPRHRHRADGREVVLASLGPEKPMGRAKKPRVS